MPIIEGVRVCSLLALMPRKQEIDKSCAQKPQKYKRDQPIVVEHGPHAEHGTD